MGHSAERPRIPHGLYGLAVLICASAPSVLAVCSQPPPRVCTEFYDSAAVFTGTVVGVRSDPGEEGSTNGWFYRVRVQKSFRGPKGPEIEVYTGNDSARFPLEKGRQYLLFARQWEPTGRFLIGDCGNSGFLEKSAEAIRQIEQIRKTKSGGEIAGRIGWGNAPEFEGVRIVAVGNERSYETKADSKGWFHIRVAEGTYRVRAEAPGRTFEAFDLTYDDPDHIVVQPGGCPQMQFMPK